MKLLTTTIMALALCLSCYSQEWMPLQSNERFTIYFAKIEHHSPSDGIDHERIVFRYENHTDEELILRFNRNVAYTPDATVIEQEQNYLVRIPAGAVVAYDSQKMYDKTYYLFSKDLRGTIKRSLLDFELTHLQVN